MDLKFIYQRIFSKSFRHFLAKRRPKKETTWLGEDVIYFRDNKIIFIHIPKAAGVSVYHGLFNRDSFGHKTLASYQAKMSRYEFKSCYKFTFVRNPYDRLHSAYFYLISGGRGEPYDDLCFNIIKDFDTFENFVLNWLTKENLSVIKHFQTQTMYLQNESGEIEMDFIGRFESLEDDYHYLRDKLSIGEALPLINKNKSKSDKDIYQDYSSEMIKIVNEIYKDDFVNFNYDIQSF